MDEANHRFQWNRATSPFGRDKVLWAVWDAGAKERQSLHCTVPDGGANWGAARCRGGGRPVIPGRKMIRGCLTQDGRAVVGYQLATTWPRGNAAQRATFSAITNGYGLFLVSIVRRLVSARLRGVLQRHHQGR